MCGEWKATTEFHNSVTGQFSYCRDCRRDHDRRYYHERGRTRRRQRQRSRNAAAREWIAELKRGIPCADCGGIFPAPVMHFDHLPGTQKIGDISVLATGRSRRVVIEELRKCELVCANCHAIRTARRANGV